MRRPLNDKIFMRWAADTAEASTCAKIKVGCIIVKDNRVVSLGYNGVPSGIEHCCDHFVGDHSPKSLGEEAFKQQHSLFSERYERHAESNAIMDALKRGQGLTGATLYCTYSPCFSCNKTILQAGITRVVYEKVYNEESVKVLQDYIIVEQLSLETVEDLIENFFNKNLRDDLELYLTGLGIENAGSKLSSFVRTQKNRFLRNFTQLE